MIQLSMRHMYLCQMGTSCRCTSGHRTCCARSRLPVVSRVFVKLHRSWLMQGVQQKAHLGRDRTYSLSWESMMRSTSFSTLESSC